MNPSASSRPTLLYRATCPQCRRLSAWAVWLSFGHIDRVPIGSARAEEVVQRHPETRGRLALLVGNRVVTDWRVVPSGALVFLVSWWRRLAAVVTGVFHITDFERRSKE